MKFEIRLGTGAQRDFYQAQAYYDREALEQTGRFVDEFFETTRRLADFPYLAPMIRGAVRRVSLRVFPYQVWYRVDDELKVVEVLALLHDRQDNSRIGADA